MQIFFHRILCSKWNIKCNRSIDFNHLRIKSLFVVFIIAMSSFLVKNSGVVIFAFCMFLCLLYALLFRRCVRHRRGDSAGEVDDLAHREAGLSQPTIDALPSFVYHSRGESKDGAAAAVDCAVCLGQVAEGEMVRQLPTCRHAFHNECIDKWLRSHSLCPLCRAETKPPPPPPPE